MAAQGTAGIDCLAEKHIIKPLGPDFWALATIP
jgi:hypothetical protein